MYYLIHSDIKPFTLCIVIKYSYIMYIISLLSPWCVHWEPPNALPRTSACSAPVQTLSVKMALINAQSIANKLFVINNFFCRESMDLMFLTETWQRNMDYSHLIKLCPADCSYISTPQLTGHGGGLAIVSRNKFTCQMVSTKSYCSFELQISRVG